MDQLTKSFVKGCQDQDTRREEAARIYCESLPYKIWEKNEEYHVSTTIGGHSYHTYRGSWRELASAIGIIKDMRQKFGV